MGINDCEGLAAYLMDSVEEIWRKAANDEANAPSLLAEVQELLALRANILRRRNLPNEVQLSLPFGQRKAA